MSFRISSSTASMLFLTELTFKASARYLFIYFIFFQILIFSPNDSLSKTRKNVFYLTQKAQIFVNLFCNLNSDWSLVPGSFLFLITLSIKRDWVRKKKIKLNFLRVFDSHLSKYLIFKRISCMLWLFWVMYQNKIWVWDELLVNIFCMIFP